MRTKTSEVDDENYNNSGVDWASYTEELGELKDSDFTLDWKINAERARRVELYRDRDDKGLDIFNGKPLPLSDLIACRGLGNLPLQVAITKLSKEELSRYPESKHYEVQGTQGGRPI